MTDFSFTGTPEYKRFIEEYSTADTISLRLKNFADLPFDKEFAIRQIECRRKAKNKIPELSASWLFPTGISIEQCTAETIARFHATLFDGCENVVDFTCGLGIDAYYISKNVGHLTTIDINSAVAETAKYNFKNIGAGNITVINGDSEGYASNIDTINIRQNRFPDCQDIADDRYYGHLAPVRQYHRHLDNFLKERMQRTAIQIHISKRGKIHPADTYLKL